MKKVLIISYNFPPRQTVGAIRPAKLAMRWADMGYQVDLVTVKPFGIIDRSIENCLSKIGRIYSIDRQIEPMPTMELSRKEGKKPQVLKPAPKNTFFKGLPHGVKSMGKELILWARSHVFVHDFRKIMRQESAAFSAYEVVFSTYTPYVSHLCGLAMKKKYPGVKWIADFRDPMVTSFTSPVLRWYFAWLQEKICRRADRLVTVSNGYYDQIFGHRYDDKAIVAYNGYAKEDYPAEAVGKEERQFSFCYVGSLYRGKRDLSLLFSVIRELIEEGKIMESDISFCYAGVDLAYFTKQAASFGLEASVRDYGLLSRKDCLELEAKCRFLVLLTWCTEKDFGAIPYKFYEYLLLRKPIISLITGSVGHELRDMIRKGRFGICVEESGDPGQRKLLKDSIASEYQKYRANMGSDYQPDESEMAKYDFDRIAQQIEGLFA